jgi:hypothetical protein
VRVLPALFVVMGCLAQGAVVAQSPPESAAWDCAGIPDDAQRLACYDRLFRKDVKREAAAIVSPPVAAVAAPVAAAAAPVAAAATPSPTSTLPPVDPVSEFGLTEQQKQVRQPRERKQPPLESIMAGVTAAEQDRQGAWRLTLDNGQVWQQTEPALGVRFQAGSSVEIRRASMGSFVLQVPGRPVIRVRRVR